MLFIFLKPPSGKEQARSPASRHRHFPTLQFAKQKETANRRFPQANGSGPFPGHPGVLIEGYVLFDGFIAALHKKRPGGLTSRRSKAFKVRGGGGVRLTRPQTGGEAASMEITVRTIFNYLIPPPQMEVVSLLDNIPKPLIWKRRRLARAASGLQSGAGFVLLRPTNLLIDNFWVGSP